MNKTNNTKTTKRSLVAAGLVLLLCIAMLVGTTFAWFTDSASTAVNKIQAGTLDVQLLDEQGNSLEGQTLVWQKAADAPADEAILWEPGCTYELQPFKIRNNGNLALKYKVVISGIDGDDELNEVIDWTYTYAKGTDSATPADLSAEGHLAANAETELITITGKMQESAGNEYQGLSIDGIAITVVATQDTVEADSFDNQYDAGAQYPIIDAAAVSGAIEAGGSVVLGTDAKTDNRMNIANDTNISLSGNRLTIGDNTKLTEGADLTVSGGTVLRETYSGYVDVRPGTTTDSVISYTDVVFDNTYKTMTYGPCTDRVKSALEFCPENGGNATFYFKNCTFNNSQVLFEGLSGTTGSFTATFENCTFNNLGTSAGIEVANYLTGTVTIKDCTFNLTATASMNAIKSSNSIVTWNFEGANTVNGYAATASGEDGTVDQIKVMTPSVKVYSINTTNGTVVNGLDTVTVTGIATK